MSRNAPWPRARRWPGGLLVLGLHLGLVALLLAVRPVARVPSAPARTAPLLQWLWPVPAPAVEAGAAIRPAGPPPPPAATATRPAASALPTPPRAAQPLAEAQPISVPVSLPASLASGLPAIQPASADAGRTSPATVGAAGAASAAAHPPASAPLNLALPPANARGPMSPAALAARAARDATVVSRDERLARALGTDTTLRTEQLADGTVRVRRSNSCVDLHPNRAQTLDPFNQSTHPMPRGAESCN